MSAQSPPSQRDRLEAVAPDVETLRHTVGRQCPPDRPFSEQVVDTFVLYFELARRHSFTLASYILALTPLVAMTMSTLFEGKRWSGPELSGAGLILAGQWLLLRTGRATEAASAT